MACDNPNCLCNNKAASAEKAAKALTFLAARLRIDCPETSVALGLFDDPRAEGGELWKACWVKGDATTPSAVTAETIILSVADENPAVAMVGLVVHLRALFVACYAPPDDAVIQ